MYVGRYTEKNDTRGNERCTLQFLAAPFKYSAKPHLLRCFANSSAYAALQISIDLRHLQEYLRQQGRVYNIIFRLLFQLSLGSFQKAYLCLSVKNICFCSIAIIP